MSRFDGFEHERRREIYEYVERHGAVDPETVRQNVLIRPDSNSKPARSGAELAPSDTMPTDEFAAHVAALERDGVLDERDGKLRVAHPVEDDATTVDLGDGETATVRPGRQEDLAGIVDVVETVASEDAYAVAKRLAEDVARDDVLLRHNDRENRVFFVATVDHDGEDGEDAADEKHVADDDVVGWLHVEAVRAPMMDHTARLTVGVRDAYRGHGLGSTLMDRGLAWADARGFEKVYQNLPATNERAVEFLEAAGWTVESTRDGHYLVDDEYVDEVQLAIWLDE